MNVRTTLAAALAAALLALATCAEPPIPTAADPAELGAEGSGELAMANLSGCRIESTFGNQHFIGWKDDRPHPDSATTVAVAEGIGPDDGPNVFWAEGRCPTGKLKLEFQDVRGLSGTEDPEPGDFRLWDLTDYYFHYDEDEYGQRWFMTYSPVVGFLDRYEVRLDLVEYVNGYRYVHASRTDWAAWGPTQDCWLYLSPPEPQYFYPAMPWHSEACKVPLEPPLG